ncbi:MAG: SpoIIE family protein phosphatase [Planctomycetota bacterium]
MKPGCWAIRVVFSLDSRQKPVVRALDEPAITLGRSSKCDLHLDDPGVSRRHATLTAEPDGVLPAAWRLVDLDSRNGTRVNGEPVTNVLLNDSDVIEVGPFVLTLGRLDEHGEWPRATPTESSPHKTVTVVDDSAANLSRLDHLGRPKVDAQQLRAVQALGHELLAIDDTSARRHRLCEFMTEPVMQGQHAAVLSISFPADRAGWNKPEAAVGPVSCGGTDQDFYISRSLLDAVTESGEAVLATRSGMEVDGGSDDASPIVELSVAPETQRASVIGCPLPPPEADHASATIDGTESKNETRDVLYTVLPARCGTGEWLALTALAVEQFDLVERAWRARAAAEAQAKTQVMLDRARKVQLALVPTSPEVEGLELALHFEPCYSVGGDYLDVVCLPDGRTLLLVMDVCGKGMAAALVSSSLHTFIHAQAPTAGSVVDLMNALNSYLCATMDDSTFVTGLAVAVDPVTGRVECVNAGHPPAILAPAPGMNHAATGSEGQTNFTEGKSSPVGYSEHSENVPLGLLPEPLTGHHFELAPDTVLALYSDGLTEIVAEDGQWISHEGLAEQLAGALADGSDDSLAAVRDRLNRRLAAIQAGAPPDDDMTFLLARRA